MRTLGVVLVTDAIGAMGLPDGVHLLGTMSVDVLNGAVRLTGETTLAGRYVQLLQKVCQRGRSKLGRGGAS